MGKPQPSHLGMNQTLSSDPVPNGTPGQQAATALSHDELTRMHHIENDLIQMMDDQKVPPPRANHGALNRTQNLYGGKMAKGRSAGRYSVSQAPSKLKTLAVTETTADKTLKESVFVDSPK